MIRIFFKNKKLTTGFMTIEVLIGVFIITISILASMTVAQKSIYVSRQALHFSQANFLLEEGAEIVRITRDNDWNNISSLVLGTDYYPLFSLDNWSLSSTPNTVGIFTRKININNVKRDDITKDISDIGTNDDGSKLVIVTVSWIEGGTTITKTLSFYIFDIFS
jgi:type II secretory pathway component PulK